MRSFLLLGMLTIMESTWNRVSFNRSIGKNTWFACDEFHLLLRDEQTARYCVAVWKQFRKYGGIAVGVTQNITDFLMSPEIENIFKNSECVILLKQSAGDRDILMEKLQMSETQMQYVTNSKKGSGLIKFGEVILPFTNKFPKDTELYKLMTSKLSDLFPTDDPSDSFFNDNSENVSLVTQNSNGE